MEQIYRKGPGMPGKAGRKIILAAAHNKFVKKKKPTENQGFAKKKSLMVNNLIMPFTYAAEQSDHCMLHMFSFQKLKSANK